MNDKDGKLIFEAYEMMYEMPVRVGSGADDTDFASRFDKGEIEKLAKYKVPDTEMINKIGARILEFIRSHEDEEYPGMIKDFKADIIEAVRDVSGIGSANGKYVARVTANALARIDGIEVDGATQRVKINDVDEKEVEDEIKDKIEKVVILQNDVKYEIGPESGATPDSDADMAHKILKKEIGAGFSADGRTIMTALLRHLSTPESRTLANQLLQSDGIILPEAEEDDEEREIDMGDDLDRSDDRYAADDYAASQGWGQELGGGSMSDY